jgi:LDH2 family malate/lactate/ureidoglycolate dehydrogenase
MTLAMERAGRHGVGVVAARRSTHYGMAGYYAMMAAQAQMIGYSTSNAGADMVAWQGRQPALGNNPIAYAVPAGRYPPIVLDMACSVAAKGRIRMAQARGERIPRGWVLGDHEDPAVAWTQPLLPFGAHKGSGLAVIGEVLAAALPAALLSVEVLRSGPIGGESRDPRGIGHVTMAIDVAAFRPVDEFLRTVDTLIEEVKATAPAPGYDEVLIPGEPEHRCREAALRDGVALDPPVVDALRVLGDETGVPFPAPA